MFEIKDIELMGENVKDKLKYCGEHVKLMPLAKIAYPHMVELNDHCRIGDFVFIFGGTGVKIGKFTDVQPHTTIWGGGMAIIGDRVSTGPGTVFLTATYSHAPGMKMVDGMGSGETVTLGGKLEIGNDVYWCKMCNYACKSWRRCCNWCRKFCQQGSGTMGNLCRESSKKNW